MQTIKRACASLLGAHTNTLGSALTTQKRTFKDGKKGRILSWSQFHNPRKYGHYRNSKEAWRIRSTPGPRPDTFISTPLSAQRNRPHLDPYVFKYVGVKADEKGRPIFDRDRRVRENETRHEFRSLLTYRNWHGSPVLHPQGLRPHTSQWANMARKGLYY